MYCTMLMGAKNRASSMTAMMAPCRRLSTPARIEKIVCNQRGSWLFPSARLSRWQVCGAVWARRRFQDDVVTRGVPQCRICGK